MHDMIFHSGITGAASLGKVLLVAFILGAICHILVRRILGRNGIVKPGLTTIRKSRIVGQKDGKRAWGVRVTHNGEELHGKEGITLYDPFEPAEYPQYFEYIADTSFKKRDKARISDAEAKIKPYGPKLLEDLQLDRPNAKENKRNIVVIEEFDESQDDRESIHNVVWELLEDPGIWKQTSHDWVNVTRVITTPGHEQYQDTNHCLFPHKKIKMLLVIGRSLVKHSRRYEERVTPGLIQRSVMQVMRHLEEMGHGQNIELDILRPTTFEELKSYLGCDPKSPDDPKRNFDIIHLDMHGLMERPSHDSDQPKRPHLIFTKMKKFDDDASVLASDVAAVLQQRTRLLVMNACNSSSATGELGILLVRTFLKESMDSVSATSYRLLESSAKIFYPRFYMSLLLNGCFNKAAADARLALRRNRVRHQIGETIEERDDSFVHWNWSRSEHVLNCLQPSRSWQLHKRMLFQLIPRMLFWLRTSICLDNQFWHEAKVSRYAMYAVHRNFHDLESHVQSAGRFDIPAIEIYALEIEYWLKYKKGKNSVYVHPRAPKHEVGFRYESIQNLIKNMVPIWVETNFVSDVYVFHIDRMLESSAQSWLPKSWSGSQYEQVIEQAEWSWSRSPKDQSKKTLESKRMIIIDDFDSLVENDEKGIYSLRQSINVKTVLAKIKHMAQELSIGGEEIYVIIIGSLSEAQWGSIRDFDLPIIGRKFAGAKVLQLDVDPNIPLSTYSSRGL